jgi:hypothetical protein
MQSRPPTEAAADSFVFCLANFGEITWWARLAAPSVSLVVNNDADFYTGSETTGHRNGRLCLYAAHSHSLVVVDVMDVPDQIQSAQPAPTRNSGRTVPHVEREHIANLEQNAYRPREEGAAPPPDG